jgi:hypothetical protein
VFQLGTRSTERVSRMEAQRGVVSIELWSLEPNVAGLFLIWSRPSNPLDFYPDF